MNLTPGPQHSATTAKLPRKRKRRSASRPSTPSARGPGKRSLVPAPPSTIPPADLPVAPNVPPGPPANQPSSTDVNRAGPVKIHNCSVEDYQRVYHEVVDDLLRYVWVKHADSVNQIITFVNRFKNLSLDHILYHLCSLHSSQVPERPGSSVQFTAGTTYQVEAVGETGPARHDIINPSRWTHTRGRLVQGWTLSSPL